MLAFVHVDLSVCLVLSCEMVEMGIVPADPRMGRAWRDGELSGVR